MYKRQHHRQAVAAHLRFELGAVREPDHGHAARHAGAIGREQGQRSCRLASFIGRVLRGAKPGDFPVELPTLIEHVINLRSARAMGLTIPRAALLRADELIE